MYENWYATTVYPVVKLDCHPTLSDTSRYDLLYVHIPDVSFPQYQIFYFPMFAAAIPTEGETKHFSNFYLG